MRDDVIDELSLENPVPRPLPAPPIEPLLDRLDARHATDGPGLGSARQGRSSGPARRLAPWAGRISFGGVVSACAVVGAILIAVAALATLGHRKAPERTAPGVTAPPTRPSSSTPASTIDAVVVAFLFFHDGADWAVGQPLRAFTSAVDVKSETRCLASDGLPGPPVYPVINEQYGSADMPNLPLIERTHGIGATERYSAPTDPARSLTGETLVGYNAALARCAAAARHAYAFITSHTAVALQGQWLNIVQQVETSSAVRAANRRGSQCSRSTPFPASGVQGEIEAIEAKLTRPNLAGQYAQADAIQARGVGVLVRCFGTDIALRSRLTAAARASFFAAHAQAIQRIEAQANRAIPVLEAKYKIRFGHINTTPQR